MSWCQFASASSHTTINQLCSDFIKANFEAVAECSDFPTMELDLLVSLVRSNDLVVADEVSSALNDIIWLKLVKYSSNQTDLPLSLRRQVAEREERLCLEELQ